MIFKIFYKIQVEIFAKNSGRTFHKKVFSRKFGKILHARFYKGLRCVVFAYDHISVGAFFFA